MQERILHTLVDPTRVLKRPAQKNESVSCIITLYFFECTLHTVPLKSKLPPLVSFLAIRVSFLSRRFSFLASCVSFLSRITEAFSMDYITRKKPVYTRRLLCSSLSNRWNFPTLNMYRSFARFKSNKCNIGHRT